MTTESQGQELGGFSQWGFTLWNPEDHTVMLLHNGRSVAIFDQKEVFEKNLQRECALHLVNCHNWDGALWRRKEPTHG